MGKQRARGPRDAKTAPPLRKGREGWCAGVRWGTRQGVGVHAWTDVYLFAGGGGRAVRRTQRGDTRAPQAARTHGQASEAGEHARAASRRAGGAVSSHSRADAAGGRALRGADGAFACISGALSRRVPAAVAQILGMKQRRTPPFPRGVVPPRCLWRRARSEAGVWGWAASVRVRAHPKAAAGPGWRRSNTSADFQV